MVVLHYTHNGQIICRGSVVWTDGWQSFGCYLWAMKAYSNVEGAFIVHEGDPMNEVLFIIRGHFEKCDNNWGLVLVFSMLGL